MSDAVSTMLEARRVALVGASPRPDSFGYRLVTEVSRSTAPVEILPVNPRYEEVLGRRCRASLDDIEGPVDLVLLGVGDGALEEQMSRAAGRGDRSAVIFGNVYEAPRDDVPPLRRRLATVATEAGMAVVGGGCMGFLNLAHGLNAVGYVEPDPLPRGDIALITHSGSAFSALLRTRRNIGYSLAVSAGQELVTSTAQYLDYALDRGETRVVALLMETLRDPEAFRRALARAAEADIPVVALTVGGSPTGRRMVSAHSGALAGDDGVWEALFDAYGVLRVEDLDEMCDTLELLDAGRRVRGRSGGDLLAGPGTGAPAGQASAVGGLATVHDSGAERALMADFAHRLGVEFATLSDQSLSRLSGLLDPGLAAENPLDVWGRGNDTRQLFADCLQVMAKDQAVALVALCIDLIHEYDDDEDYQLAAMDAFGATDKPFAVVSNAQCALDPVAAARLRSRGIPVLEGTRSGLRALGHLLDLERTRLGRSVPGEDPTAAGAATGAAGAGAGIGIGAGRRAGRPEGRQANWRGRLAGGPLDGVDSFQLLRDYGLQTVEVRPATTRHEALAAGAGLGYPVVLKTDAPGIDHKSDVGGVVLGLEGPAALGRAFDEMAARLGPRVLVAEAATEGVELSLGVVHDPQVGPLVVVASGGVLIELLGDRSVGLPPLDPRAAGRMVDRLVGRRLLDGYRGSEPADIGSLVGAVVAVSELASELGDVLEALDVNPLRCGPEGAVALDALVVARRPTGAVTDGRAGGGRRAGGS